MARIEFKTKVHEIKYADGTTRSLVKVPTLKRSHCNMEEFRKHPRHGRIANSDLFPNVLAWVRKNKLGECFYLDCVPEGVTVDTSGYLALVSIDV